MKKLFFIVLILFFFTIIAAGSIAQAQGNDSNALAEAIKSGKIEEVKRLIEKGVDVNTSDDKGFAPLAVAAANGYTEIVKLIESAGGN